MLNLSQSLKAIFLQMTRRKVKEEEERVKEEEGEGDKEGKEEGVKEEEGVQEVEEEVHLEG